MFWNVALIWMNKCGIFPAFFQGENFNDLLVAFRQIESLHNTDIL